MATKSNTGLNLYKLLAPRFKNPTNEALFKNLFDRFTSGQNSERLLGWVGQNIDGDLYVPQSNFERELNALSPVLVNKLGSETNIVTFNDIINKLNRMGVNTDNLGDWGATYEFNYTPPINMDKFANFSKYRWIGHLVNPTPSLSWNPELKPEYYVIGWPTIPSKIKLPVKVAAQEEIVLAGEQVVDGVSLVKHDRVLVTSQLDTVENGIYEVNAYLEAPKVIFTGGVLDLGNVNSHKAADATAVITNGLVTGVTLGEPGLGYTLPPTVVFVGGNSTGATGIANLGPNGEIASVTITSGGAAWVRTTDADSKNEPVDINGNIIQELSNGCLVYVAAGNTLTGTVFELTATEPVIAGNTPQQWTLTSLLPTVWTIHNYWVHENDVALLGLDINLTKQALRPIIEYHWNLEMFDTTVAGKPVAPGTVSNPNSVQIKTRFNQLPLFNLYALDHAAYPAPQPGVHAGLISPIFYYKEDVSYDVDEQLGRRISSPSTGDYTFIEGCLVDKKLYGYHLGEELTVPWTRGNKVSPAWTRKTPNGNHIILPNGPRGEDQIELADLVTPTATSTTNVNLFLSGEYEHLGTTFVAGKKVLVLDQTNPAENGLYEIRTGPWARIAPLSIGQMDVGSLHVKVETREFVLVTKTPAVVGTDNLTFVEIDPTKEAAWKTPPMMENNLSHETKKEIGYANLKLHLSDIISHQPGLIGSPYGRNNARELPLNAGLGGIIKDFDSSWCLLAGTSAMSDITILSVIDFAEQAYARALNDAIDFLNNQLVYLISNDIVDPISSVDKNANTIVTLVNYYLSTLKTNTFVDTTAGVKGWPITMPYIGACSPMMPKLALDPEIGQLVIRHHDGHLSSAYLDDVKLKMTLGRVPTKRSDGNLVAGHFGTRPPAQPYRNQLWFNTNGSNTLSIFNVVSDGEIFAEDRGNAAADEAEQVYRNNVTTIDVAELTRQRAEAKISAMYKVSANLKDGDFWFKRSTRTLYAWNDTTKTWEALGNTEAIISSAYGEIRLDALYNSFILNLETKMYEGASKQDLKKDILSLAQDDARLSELYQYAAKYRLDTWGTDFDNNNPFTWNYTLTTFNGFPGDILGTTPKIARWFNLYKKYTASAMYPNGTARPDLEPWVLSGDDEVTFKSLWPAALFNSPDMWNYVKAKWQKPMLVDPATGTLLPPYVSNTHPAALEALTNIVPAKISARYILGDDGPVELSWKKSLEYRYSLLRVAFKKNPLDVLDQYWGDNQARISYYPINRRLGYRNTQFDITLHGEAVSKQNRQPITRYLAKPHTAVTYTFTCVATLPIGARFTVTDDLGSTLLQDLITGQEWTSPKVGLFLEDGGISFNIGDKVIVKCTAIDFTSTFIPAAFYRVNGINQLLINQLRYNNIDAKTSAYISSLRNWQVKLGYRADAMLNHESLKIKSDAKKLSSSDYELHLKTNELVGGSWAHSIRIQLVQVGQTAMSNGQLIPAGTGDDWKFRLELYNYIEPTVTLYEWDKTEEYLTFNSLAAEFTPTVWKKYLKPARTIKAVMPTYITGVQNVIDFLFGYYEYLHTQGWRDNDRDVPVIDQATGRAMGVQLEVEKFVTAVYTAGLKVGSGTIVAPFMKQVWLDTANGLGSKLAVNKAVDARVASSVYDFTASAIDHKYLRILRDDQQTTIISQVPMMSVHLSTDTYEHIMVFNDYAGEITPTNLIYDPFLGIKISRLYLDSDRSPTGEGKPSYAGYFTHKQQLKPNIVSSINDILDHYSPEFLSRDTLSAKHAQALLGYNKKNYFDNIDAGDESQFHFWRGLIHNKGSNGSLDAFLNSAKFKSAKLDEFWAFKLAEYGDARPKTYPEIKIESDDVKHRYTLLRFLEDGEDANTITPNYLTISPTDETRWYTTHEVGTHLYFEAEILAKVTGTGQADDLIKLPLPASMITGPAILINQLTAKLTGTGSYELIIYGPSAPKFNPAMLLNYRQGVKVTDIPIWDPARGIHTPEGLEGVNVTATEDPAKYNHSTKVTNNTSYDPIRPWGSQQVGKTWWNTANLAYVPYSDTIIYPDIEQRINRWGSLADYGTVDLYEWVESTVPPSNWETLASAQEGDADIATTQRVSGKAAKKSLYTRTRQWHRRPIAWQYALNPPGGFNYASGTAQQRLMLTDVGPGRQTIILNADRFKKFGLKNGLKVAAQDKISGKPAGTGTLVGTVGWVIGNSSPLGWGSNLVKPATGSFGDMLAEPSAAGSLGNFIGKINFSSAVINSKTYVIASSELTSDSQAIEVTSVAANTKVVIDFNQLGIKLSALTTAAVTTSAIATAFGDATIDVYVRETMPFDVELSFPAEILDPATPGMGNEPTDVFPIPDWSFVAWQEPTIDQLANDLPAPNNHWQPVPGDWVVAPHNAETVALAKLDAVSPISLADGTLISRINSVWGEWETIEAFKSDKIILNQANTTNISLADTPTSLLLATGKLNPDNIRVYQNGSLIIATRWSLDDTNLILNHTVQAGDIITVIVNKPEPTSSELEFDPEVIDDPRKARQFKYDYDYTVIPQRDSEGNIAGKLYYFWVKDKTFPAPGKRISIKNAAEALTRNKNLYLVLEDIKPATNDVPARFVTAAICGANRIVTRDNVYKIRFTRDFTLRDDPNGISLKNVHTEWALLRQNQTSKIPAVLWNKLVDAICGQDLAGQPVPAKKLVDYDNRHNTQNRFGFDQGQAFVDGALGLETVKYTILNTTVTTETPDSPVPIRDSISVIDLTNLAELFSTPALIRSTLSKIWAEAKASQVNEIFFAVLEDALTNNSELTHMFKTSMLSAYSIRVLPTKQRVIAN